MVSAAACGTCLANSRILGLEANAPSCSLNDRTGANVDSDQLPRLSVDELSRDRSHLVQEPDGFNLERIGFAA